MEQFFANFKWEADATKMNQLLQQAKDQSEKQIMNVELITKLIGFVDLTSLNTDDSTQTIQELCEKVNRFNSLNVNTQDVAAVCVYPVFAPVLKGSLHNQLVRKAVVAGCFPSSQTFTDIKVMEVKKAVDFGVDEIDLVISVGEFLDGNYEFVLEEIRVITDAIPERVALKIILETGLLVSHENIWRASLLAMEGGADFIKTSTGKVSENATPESVYIMCQAIKSFEKVTGKKVGIKVSGGIKDTSSALLYYSIVEQILGEEWLTKDRFRIGASSLVNDLLKNIYQLKGINNKPDKYF